MANIGRSRRAATVDLATLSPMQWGVVALATTTGTIQLIIALDSGTLAYGIAALGFYVGVAGLLVNRISSRQLVYLAGIPFTFAQIVGYFIAVQPTSVADVTLLAILDTFIQANLIVLLTILLLEEWNQSGHPNDGGI